MKKVFLVLFVLCSIATVFTGCKPELKNLHGQVKSVEIKNDTIKSMMLSVGDEVKTVMLQDARFQNGLAIEGDSIILDYIDGKNNELRALVVTVLPRPAQYFEPSDSIVTRGAKASTDSIKNK